MCFRKAEYGRIHGSRSQTPTWTQIPLPAGTTAQLMVVGATGTAFTWYRSLDRIEFLEFSFVYTIGGILLSAERSPKGLDVDHINGKPPTNRMLPSDM